ncbi:MAG TPA: TonB-dependent receptor [Gammaproteobacteria bacterium]
MRIAVLMLLCAAIFAAVAQADDTTQLGKIDVVEPAPLPGLGVPTDQVPAAVQSADGDDIRAQHSETLSDYLDANFQGLTLNETQGDPFQADLQYHGFTASPLLGAPEGLSVYVDGVRVNEAFGDAVNWDLIPDSALSKVVLIPGSDPVFGLNTLGGALALTTRNGRESPGYETQASIGSYGGRDAEGAAGGASGKLDWFVTGHYFQERDWRDASPSRLSQVFGKLGWQDDQGRVDLSYTGADTRLTGNGTTPDSLLARDEAAIYTAPDTTANHLDFLNLTALRFIGGDLYLSGNAYYRDLKTDSENGDVNDDDYLDDSAGFPPPDCSSIASDPISQAYCSQSVDRRSLLTQRSEGVGGQLTRTLQGSDQFVAGFSWDGSDDGYAQTIQYGGFSPGRVFLADAVGPQPITDIAGTTGTLGVYLMDSYSATDWLQFTGSVRWNREHLTLQGRSVDTELDDVGQGFDASRPVIGSDTFQRLNPALGFTAKLTPQVTFYGDYNEGMRAPTVIELGCADPEVPCGLPDDFASDPPLKPVIAHTFELGLRSHDTTALQWGADIFRARNSDDIQFISAPGDPSAGYFANVGDTLRRGLDAHLGGVAGSLTWQVSASFLRATYESEFNEGDEDANSSANAADQVAVHPGDRLPLTPESTGRTSATYAITDRWSVGGNLLYSGGSTLRGNEDGINQAGQISGSGEFIQGSGRIGGYNLLGLRTAYQCTDEVSLFMRMDNVLDRRYATAGFLSDVSFAPDGAFRTRGAVTHEDAVSPGAPRTLWLGIDVSWK